VGLARRRYPDADISWGDARDLSPFADGTFDMVMFSWNGIDTLDRKGRLLALAEIARVLKTDGVFVFSTLNLHGMSFSETPFQLHRPGQPVELKPEVVAQLLWRNVTDPGRFGRRVKNWRASKRQAQRGEGWATAALSSLDFQLLNHFTSLPVLLSDLRGAGLEPEVVFDIGPQGAAQVVPQGTPCPRSDLFHVVAVRSALPALAAGA